LIPSIVSHYKILEKLGEGGMGVVFKAQDTKLDRLVALKFLPARLADSEESKARLIQEAKAASALNHPNVCTIHEIGEHDGQLFVVMEFVAGQTLHEKILEGRLPVKQAIEIGIQIADGLAAAHEKGIVHRDVKPDNIMVRRDGIVQIMDFGLAKIHGVSRLTKEGSTIGTAGYMSPELVQGHDADHRSDIFSLGVVLYEMLTGHLPFRGIHETAMMYEIVNVDPPPPSSIRPEIDADMDRIVLESLEKDPNERMQSARQVSIDLRRYRRESERQRVSGIAPPGAATAGQKSGGPNVSRRALSTNDDISPPVRRLLPWGLACVLGVVAVLALWNPWRRIPPPPPVVRFSLSLPKESTIPLDENLAVAISRDGNRIVYATENLLHLRSVDNMEAVPVAGTEKAAEPVFSPDGKWIAFFSGGKLKKVPVGGGTSTALCDVGSCRGITWGVDDQIVFSSHAAVGLSAISASGGPVRVLTTPDTSRHERTHRWPRFVGDSKTVLFTVGEIYNPDYYDDAYIDAVNLDTGVRKRILAGANQARFLTGGYLVYGKGGTLFAERFDVDRLETIGQPVPVLEDVGGDPTAGVVHFSLSDNGSLVYVPGGGDANTHTLAWVDRSGEREQIPAPLHAYQSPRLSPDGKRISLVIEEGKELDLWIYDIAGQTLSRLTFGGLNLSPLWSRDGKRVFYTSRDVGGGLKILSKSADGSGDAQELYSGTDELYIDGIYPDGMTLLLDRVRPEPYGIMALPLGGDRKLRPVLQSSAFEHSGALSPDGRWIAYTSNETQSYQIYVQPFPPGGGKWQITTDGGVDVHWSRDGRELFYREGSALMVVAIQTQPAFQAGKPKLLFEEHRTLFSTVGHTFDVSLDGKRLLLTGLGTGDQGHRVNVILHWAEEVRRHFESNK
jgi:serine/threonine-protein kinase